jgi:hypothetical protein
MAKIRNIVTSATKGTTTGDTWTITAHYDFEVNDDELKLGFKYKDCFEVWEDDPWKDQKLTKKVSCSVFKPSANLTKRTLTTRISSDNLNTEFGGEEIYVKVYLENDTLNFPYPPKRSSNLYLKA